VHNRFYADDAAAAATSHRVATRYEPETPGKAYYGGIYRDVFRDLRFRLRDVPSAR
jgi:hypothetical protein